MKLNDYEKNLVAYMEQNVPSGKHMVFSWSCHSVAEAALSAEISPEEIVKNVCMITIDGELIVAIMVFTQSLSGTAEPWVFRRASR